MTLQVIIEDRPNEHESDMCDSMLESHAALLARVAELEENIGKHWKPPFELPLRIDRWNNLVDYCNIVDQTGILIRRNISIEKASYLILAVNSFEPLVEIVKFRRKELNELLERSLITDQELEQLDVINEFFRLYHVYF